MHTIAGAVLQESGLVHYYRALALDPRIQPGFGQVFVATATPGWQLSEATMARIAAIEKAHVARFWGARYAIVDHQRGADWYRVQLALPHFFGELNEAVRLDNGEQQCACW